MLSIFGDGAKKAQTWMLLTASKSCFSPNDQRVRSETRMIPKSKTWPDKVTLSYECDFPGSLSLTWPSMTHNTSCTHTKITALASKVNPFAGCSCSLSADPTGLMLHITNTIQCVCMAEWGSKGFFYTLIFLLSSNWSISVFEKWNKTSTELAFQKVASLRQDTFDEIGHIFNIYI